MAFDKLIASWFDAKGKLDRAKEDEMNLRKAVIAMYFKNPKEGTNKHDLGGGYKLNMKHVLNRKIDIGLLETFRDTFEAEDINVDELIKQKPELVVSKYKSLSEDKQKIFDQVLEIKEGTGSLEVVKQKRD